MIYLDSADYNKVHLIKNNKPPFFFGFMYVSKVVREGYPVDMLNKGGGGIKKRI